MGLRAKRNPSWTEQQKAVELLVTASGFRSKAHGRSFPFNGTYTYRARGAASSNDAVGGGHSGGSSSSLLASPVGLQDFATVNISQAAHRGALRELGLCFQEGFGVYPHMRLALELLRAAAAAGDPGAHGHMALRFAVGLDQGDCWTADGVARFAEPKPQEALLHYTFGALGGDPASRMALAYRHLHGLGVPKSCWSAAAYYQPVAEEVTDLAAEPAYRLLGGSDLAQPPPPPRGTGFPSAAATADGVPEPAATTTPPPSASTSTSTGDAAKDASTASTTTAAGTGSGAAASSGGISGGSGSSGSSGSGKVAADGVHGGLPHIERIRLALQNPANGGLRSERHREVVQYYQYSADRGNTEAQTAVGQVLNFGTHGVERDHAAALSYFRMAAAAGDAEAMAHLGSMCANGYGTEQSYKEAHEWWSRAARRNNPHALFGLGYLHLAGLGGVSADADRAFHLFSKAAEQGHADAHFFLGVMHQRGLGVRRKSVQRAFTYFSLAAHAGHALSQYNAAMMHLAGKGTPRNCKPAVTQLKSLAEKGPAAAALQAGHEAYFRGRFGAALLAYLRAADLGVEVAQSNAAWMLERGYAVAPTPASSALSFSLYRQSAAQGNVASLLSLGDAYFYGRGVEQDWVRSAAVYYEAYQERSAEAMFNLGFMHEFGVGVPKDLQLALRFYNMAKHTQADAAVPVALARAWLKVHGWWDALRPHLPESLRPLWASVFVLRPPHTSLFGPWVAHMQQLLPNLAVARAEVLVGRWMDVLGVSGGISSLLSLGDGAESVALLVLLGGLVLVMRLRRQRAEVRQAQARERGGQGQGQGLAGEDPRVVAAREEVQRVLQQVRQQQREQEQRDQQGDGQAGSEAGGAAVGQAGGSGASGEAPVGVPAASQ